MHLLDKVKFLELNYVNEKYVNLKFLELNYVNEKYVNKNILKC